MIPKIDLTDAAEFGRAAPANIQIGPAWHADPGSIGEDGGRDG